MAIADKLTQIAENEQKVYEAGHDAGYTEGLNKGGYADGYEQGKKEEYDAFWDAFQNYGKRVDYQGGFYGSGWNDSNFKPKYDMKPNNCSQMFVSSKITDLCAALDRCGVTLDTSASARVDSMYYYTNIIKAPTLDTRKSANLDSTFNNATKMESVEKILLKDDGSQRFNNSFVQATALKDITFDGVIGLDINFQHSTKLSADSIINIIEHLSLTASGKTLTLSRTAVENADFGGGDNVYVSTGGTVRGAYVHFNPISLKAGDKIKFSIVVADGHHYNNYDWEHPSDWYVGMNPYSGEPTYTDEIYTAQNDEQLNYLMAYVITPSAMTVSFKLRAVLIDDNGNEITGENLAVPITGDFTANDYDYGNVEYTVSEESWETLQASKPNWTITLV